ncbi:Wadjet anti-phage system protein JetD domain-containing protein [Streptomyces sp. NPDC005385]|uniref:Wadjet anti-phage system protein JetD domain-containing protein n=1 Tax=Streptomyces sp. NPDC005385 TaxID=3157039 RepID=UPI0033B8F1CB
MSIADVKAVFLHLPRPPGRSGELPDRILREYLTELTNEGHVKPSPKTNRERKIPLPLSIRLTPVRSKTKSVVTAPPLTSELADVAEFWGLAQTTDRIRAAYEALNAWRLRGNWGMRIPLRERALQVFGHHPFFQHPDHPAEKLFDTLRAKPLFSDAKRLLKLLNAFNVDPPLLSKDFSSTGLAKNRGGYHQLGSGRRLLVIENSTTYWSLSHMLGHIDHRIGHVAWGSGVTFQRSIGSLTARDRVSDIVYFGDLDPSGLAFPIRAGNYVRGLQVRPAVELYDALLRLGRPSRSPSKEASVTQAQAQRLVSWLDPRHHEPVHNLLLSGERLAQEWVGFDHLSTSERWHADVG